MGISNGQITNADEVLNAIGATWANGMQPVFNANYVGLDSSYNGGNTWNLKNVEFETGLLNIGAFAEIDKFDDSSVDTSLWVSVLSDSYRSVRSISEVGDRMILQAGGNNYYSNLVTSTATVTGNGTSPEYLITGSYFLDYDWTAVIGSGNGQGKVIIAVTDGTSSVNLVSFYNYGGGTFSGYGKKRININKENKTCGFLDNFTDVTDSSTSLSALDNTKDWYFSFYVLGRTNEDSSDRGIVNLYINSFYKTGSAVNTIDFGEVDEPIESIMFTSNEMPTNGLTTYRISTDNGVTFNTVSPETVYRPITLDNHPILEITATYNESDGILTKINEAAIKYNLY